MIPNLGPYAKALVAAVIAGAGALGTALQNDGVISGTEWCVAAAAFIIAAGAVFGSNLQIKWLVGTAVAFLAALGTALEDGSISGQEISAIVVTTLTALATIWSTPNAIASDSASVKDPS